MKPSDRPEGLDAVAVDQAAPDLSTDPYVSVSGPPPALRRVEWVSGGPAKQAALWNGVADVEPPYTEAELASRDAYTPSREALSEVSEFVEEVRRALVARGWPYRNFWSVVEALRYVGAGYPQWVVPVYSPLLDQTDYLPAERVVARLGISRLVSYFRTREE